MTAIHKASRNGGFVMVLLIMFLVMGREVLGFPTEGSNVPSTSGDSDDGMFLFSSFL